MDWVMTPDGKRVYASSDGDSAVSVISTATDEVIARIKRLRAEL
jgi:YVTN family beta-propeller protein